MEFINSIKYLLSKGIDINKTNEYNECALSVAYNNQNFDVLKLLIEKNVNININIRGTPFTIELLKTFSFIQGQLNNRKKRLLREIINLCFDKIIDVNIIDPSNGCTLLMIIYIFFERDIYLNQYFYKIIDIGADLNIRDNNGYTILMWLAENKNISISQKLLSNPNINLKNNEGDIALKVQNTDFINLLLNDDRLNKTSKSLNNAILMKNINIVKLLINKNFPINSWKKYINKKRIY